jgi:starch-binding outer membrane protein, SusD/RagB family
MKKILFILSITVALIATSCDDYLEAPTQSSLDEQVIFSTPVLAERAVMGIIQSFAETNSYRGRFLPWYGANTDIEWYNSSQTTDDRRSEIVTYNLSTTNQEMNTANNAWAMMYQGIERANLAIRGLRNSELAVPGSNLGHLLAEALTLRAVLYSDLVKGWGDVPARFEPITSETMYLARSNKDVIYKQLLADLEEAAELAFWPNAHSYTASSGRVNKTFVKGLRARIALAAGGYSQQADGEIRLSPDPSLDRANMYKIAEKELLDVVSFSGSGFLESSFETVFRKLNQENMAAGGESVWEIPFSNGRGRMAYQFAVKHDVANQYTAMPQGGTIGPTPNLFYDYNVNDTRRDITCVPYRWEGNPAKQVLRALNSWNFGKYRFEWMNRRVTSTNDDGVNKQYMRYAEIVLMLAEVKNELEGPASAAPYLSEIRRRAFPQAHWGTQVESYVASLSSKEAMFNAIVDEYAYEFAGEMLRKESLIRWNLLKVKMDDTKAKMYELRDRRARYADVPEYLYYRYANDNETLEIYGLNRGENENKTVEYANNLQWVSPGKINDTKIETIYVRNPDRYQYWPIWQVFLDTSNGMLKNNANYAN